MKMFGFTVTAFLSALLVLIIWASTVVSNRCEKAGGAYLPGVGICLRKELVIKP